MGIRVERHGKLLRIYPHKKGTAILAFFKITEEWWEELKADFPNGVGVHVYNDVELSIMYVWNTPISEFYRKIENHNWWKDGKTVAAERTNDLEAHDRGEETC